MNPFPYRNILITGGSGFIGSALIRFGLSTYPEIESIVNLDLLTYASSKHCEEAFANDSRYHFVEGDICNQALLQSLCEEFSIDAIIHSAAETHVDRSIENPHPFIQANIIGTFSLLETVRSHPKIRFHHISTDEVFGSAETKSFDSNSPYRPNSPYSATKASSDHLVRAWSHTYGLKTSLSNCSNNYGPYQHREKLIPKTIHAAIEGTPIPIYGSGQQVRDWLFVDDHAEAVWKILASAPSEESYLLGGEMEKSNLELISLILHQMAEETNTPVEQYLRLIQHVQDRPGHDFRYAINSSHAQKRVLWAPRHSLKIGLQKTITWYLHHALLHS